jgi:hypothetical protein
MAAFFHNSTLLKLITHSVGCGLITRRVMVFFPSSIARTIGVLNIIGL